MRTDESSMPITRSPNGEDPALSSIGIAYHFHPTLNGDPHGSQEEARFFRRHDYSQEGEPQSEGFLGTLWRHPVGWLPLRVGSQYTEAIGYASKVIAAGYTLESNYSNLFLADNNLRKNEIIFPPCSLRPAFRLPHQLQDRWWPDE